MARALPLDARMQNTRFLDRRELTAEAVLALLSGVVIHTLTFNPTSTGPGY